MARFRLAEKGRKAHPGDPVLNPKGQVVGMVTSCAIDSEGLWTGLAYVEESLAVEGTPISVYLDAGKAKAGAKALAELKQGDRVPLPARQPLS